MSTMHRTLATLGACAVVSVSIAACSSSGGSSASSSGSASSGSKSSPVKILAVVDTSGPNKSVGVPELSGIQAGAAYVNAHGGILGRKVQVTVADDNGDPTTADTAVIQALSSNPTEYSMIWGGEEGTETSALIPVIKRYKAYAIAINDGTNLCQNASNCPTEFTLTGSSQIPEEAQAAWFKSHGYKNVGILDEGIAFTQTEATDLAADLAKDGIKTETESFPTSAVSVTPEMSALKSGGAQAVYAAMFGPPEGYILNARPELGWQVPVLFESAGSSLDISTLAPASEMTDAYETPFYCETVSHSVPGLALIPKYGNVNESLPCSSWGQGWDGVLLLRAAATKAGSLEASALTTATQSLNVTTSDNMVFQTAYCYKSTDHENVCSTPVDYQVEPVGAISTGQLHPVG